MDHSTFSKNRHGRFRDSDLFRQLFEQVVRLCMQAGLVGGEGFAIDASVIEADASLRRKAEGKLTAWPEAAEVSRPVREYLDALDQAAAAEAGTSTLSSNHSAPRNVAKYAFFNGILDFCTGRGRLAGRPFAARFRQRETLATEVATLF